jgi:hypothetical protein
MWMLRRVPDGFCMMAGTPVFRPDASLWRSAWVSLWDEFRQRLQRRPHHRAIDHLLLGDPHAHLGEGPERRRPRMFVAHIRDVLRLEGRSETPPSPPRGALQGGAPGTLGRAVRVQRSLSSGGRPRAAHDSPAYQEALAVLAGGAERDIRIVEGV